MESRLKLWIEDGGEVVLSDWRISLLHAVEQTGSLAGAAARLHVPYRTAWQKLKQMEQRLGLRLVESHAGGAAGGSTRLTAEGQALIARYARFADGLHQEVERRYAEAFADLRLPASPADP